MSGPTKPAFRLDRLLTLNVFHPLAKLLRGSGTAIPILMYHSIGGEDRDGRHPYYATGTSREAFAQQMTLLRDWGYTVITTDEIVSALRSGSTHKTVAITFDDGFRDFATGAFPILNELGFKATMFLPTAFIGDTRKTFQGTECLTWDEVRELRRAGMVFGSHTVTHPELKRLKRPEVEEELRVSKQTIEAKLGEPVRTFCCPFAFPDANLEFKRMLADVLESNGYQAGVSTIIGTARDSDNRYFMKRLPVNTWDDAKLFRAKLEGGYDWLRPAQYCAKAIKGAIASKEK